MSEQVNEDGEGTEVPSAQDPYIAPDPDDPTVTGGTDHAGNPIGSHPAAAEVVPVATVTPTGAPVAQVTQVRRPWRSVARTVFQAALALATLLPFVLTGVYGDDDDIPAVVAQVLVVAGGFARVMALPQVEEFLRTFLPFLAAAPKREIRT